MLESFYVLMPSYWEKYGVSFTLCAIYKLCGQILGYFLPSRPSLFAFVYTLLDKVYIVKLSLPNPSPLNYPRGLWMPSLSKKRGENNFVFSIYMQYLHLWQNITLYQNWKKNLINRIKCSKINRISLCKCFGSKD